MVVLNDGREIFCQFVSCHITLYTKFQKPFPWNTLKNNQITQNPLYVKIA